MTTELNKPVDNIWETFSLGMWLMLKNQEVEPVPVDVVIPELFCLTRSEPSMETS